MKYSNGMKSDVFHVDSTLWSKIVLEGDEMSWYGGRRSLLRGNIQVYPNL